MQDVAPEEVVRLGTTEIWEFANDVSGMGMMNMPMVHPMHIHAVQFQVLNRWGVRRDGYVDKGWKDTVLLLPGDGGMMRNFRIVL